MEFNARNATQVPQETSGKNKKVVLAVAILIVVAAVGYIFFSKNSASDIAADLKADPKAAAAKVQEVASLVGKLMQLPAGETPSLAVVTDEKALVSSNVFFKDVKNNDYVLFYNKLAVVYRPTTNAVVVAGPIVLDGQVAGAQVTSQAPQVDPANVIILNASGKSGVAADYKAKLEAAIPVYKVVSTASSKGKYPSSRLINLTGKNTTLLEAAMGIKQETSMPSDEDKASADIVIILGEDYKATPVQ